MQGLGCSIRGCTVHDNARAGAVYSLPVQRIGHHLFDPDKAMKDTARPEAHGVAQGKLFLQRAVRRHPVVHPARKIANLGVQRAAHGDVHLLKATADAQKRLAPLYTGAHQRQGDRIAAAVKAAMCFGFFLAVFLRMHIRAAAGQKEAVAQVKKVRHRHIARV